MKITTLLAASLLCSTAVVPAAIAQDAQQQAAAERLSIALSVSAVALAVIILL